VAEPFSAEQATLKIAVTGDLADTLVVPILKGREKGEVVVANGKSFFTSRPSAGVTRRVIVERIPGDGAFDRLAEKKADLVISDLQPGTLQRQKFSSSFSGAAMDSHSNAQVIAMDALTFVVHPDNRLDRLSGEDLQRGQNFLGGVQGSAEQAAATRFGISLSSNSDRRAADAVLSDTSAIGVGLYHNEGSNIRAKRLAYQAAPNAVALKPSPFTIATEDYKFSFRIVAWNSPSSSRDAVDLVKFITSPAGQDLVGQQGFVDLRLRPMAGDLDPRILAALAQATGLKKISGAQRLSTNFRFATGEDRFDLKALGDLERVPPQIARDFPNARVVILGFTDNTGGGAVNLPLSQRRAEAVATELRRSGLDAKTAGMGDQLPVDSNSTEEGKARNRRSEIWIVTP
jgi:phosphate transport system substrate-binding protein